MESTPQLYQTLCVILGCHQNWADLRHLKTLSWMVTGLILSGKIGLGAWTSYVHSRAEYASSVIRRFRRFLDNDRIEVHPLYGPLLQQALREWGYKTLYVALDTSMLWNTYCMVRLSLIYRGRAIPIVWIVLQHGSSSIALEDYQALLDRAAQLLFPYQGQVIFLADRGFADTGLMRYLRKLGWSFRIRIKESFWIYRPGQRPRKVNCIPLSAGHPLFWHHIQITKERFGEVHLALGRPIGNSRDRWVVISDEPTSLETFREYGLRFDIEENFLDDKSNGFQLEASLIRSPKALERLCLVLAVATLYLVCQGAQVVEAGKRRLVDAHWFRGKSYLKIGWDWVKRALSRGEALLTRLFLSPKSDPEPAMASLKQHQKRTQPRFTLKTSKAA
jgi:hypothetical protein